MDESSYNVVIIGGGPGGAKAAEVLGKLGKRVALVNHELGGECLNWGCIPTKSLLWSAELFEKIGKSKINGVDVENVTLNFQQMMKRKSQVVSMLGKGVEMQLKTSEVELIQGMGEIVSENKVKVISEDKSSRIIETEHVIISTGSSPAWLPGTQPSGNVMDNRNILDISELPESLVVIGGGVIGCEFANLFNILGVKVTIIEYTERLLFNEDFEISDFLQKKFQRSGMEVCTSCKVTEVQDKGDSVSVSFENSHGEVISVEAKKALMAVGRRPNMPTSAIDIAFNNRGFVTSEFMQTSVPSVYAVGDVAGKSLLAYTAEREGEIAASHIAGKKCSPINYSNIPSAIFTEPSIASIGMTEQKASEQKLAYITGKSNYGSNGKAMIQGDREGIVKLMFEAESKRFIGGHIAGRDAPEFISLLSLAINKNLSLWDLKEILFPHPVINEVIKEAIENAYTL